MKQLKIHISSLLCLLLAVMLSVPALADEGALPSDAFSGSGDASFSLDGKTWDELVTEFAAAHDCGETSIALGYCNTVTGETHYYRGSDYMEAGSMYKVPLTMAFAERILSGELTEEDYIGGYRLQTLLYGSIVNSDNVYATALWTYLGTYNEYRDIIAPYMGVEPGKADPKYYENRFFTAEQVIHCLLELYSNPEKYPGIEDLMKQAEPENYFNFHEQKFPIAHKYGYIDDVGFFVNDCAICYTDDPICIVMFTENLRYPNQALADFCTLMIDYAQASREQRLSQEEVLALAEQARAEEEARLSAEQKAPELDSAVQNRPAPRTRRGSMKIYQAVAIGLAAAAVLAVIFRKKKLSAVPAVLSVAAVTLAAVFCILADTKGTLFLKTDSSPEDCVACFFDNLTDGNYEEAYSCLKDYSSLGLEVPAEDGSSQKIREALQSSYSYALVGECERRDLTAVQTVRFSYLDIASMTEDLQQEVGRSAAGLVERLPAREIYGEDGSYLPEFTDAAYADAVDTVLADCEKYRTETVLNVNVICSEGQWKMEVPSVLLTALCGGSLS